MMISWRKCVYILVSLFALLSCTKKDKDKDVVLNELEIYNVVVSDDCMKALFSASLDSEYDFDRVGFEYADNEKFISSNAVESVLRPDGHFESLLGAIEFGKVYYVRALASNNRMVLYSDIKSFKISGLQKYCTLSKPSVDATSRVLRAASPVILCDGLSIESCGFQLSGSSEQFSSECTADGVLKEGLIYCEISDIEIRKFRYIRSFVKVGNETLYSELAEITIPLELLTLSRPLISEITEESAMVSVSIVDESGTGMFDCGVEYSNIPGFLEGSKNRLPLQKMSDASYSANISNLKPGTIYYVRAYAVNPVGISYSQDVSFKTDELKKIIELPSVSKPDISDVTAESSTVSVTIVDKSGTGISEYGIVYSDMPGLPSGFITRLPLSKVSDVLYSTSISGLKPCTTYYVRAYAVNLAGISYSQDASFTTDEKVRVVTLPSISNPDISSITSTSAKVTVVVTDDGGGEIYKCGVVYSDVQGIPAESATRLELSKTSSLTYASGISDLASGTVYYVRAYATNSAGTVYSRDESFMTTTTRPSLNGHEYVDLGLPSKIKWSVCNIGADDPYELGDYFSWGEIEKKDNYVWETYKFYSGMNGQFAIMTKYTRSYNPELLEDVVDVATQKYGEGWRMPKPADWNELAKSCSISRGKVNGHDVLLVTGPNGASMVLPANTGVMIGKELTDQEYDFYWSSLQYTASDKAYRISVGYGYDSWWFPRYYGCQVRAVCE